jgi:hypothetical protein
MVRSPWRAEESPSIYHLAPCDQTSVAIATCRATFWAGDSLDPVHFERCLELVMEDLPFLAGRMAPVNLLNKWKMGDLHILNNNQGVELTIVDVPHLAMATECGADTWPMRNVTISNPQVPFYLPTLDVSPSALLSGKEPLCKVQLTRMADGCVLGISLSHVITDGMHWPALMGHIAARYRQVITGQPAPSQELVALTDRRDAVNLQALKSNIPK